MKEFRGLIYRTNVKQKNHRMVPAILIEGEPGVGKNYLANVIAAHLEWLTQSPEVVISGYRFENQDIYRLARAAGLRTQTLTAIPDTLAESILFGARRGAYTDATKDRLGLFDCDSPIDVFLDEIGDASLALQGKLLEVLETRTFRPLGSSFNEKEKITDARIIAATNRDLADLIGRGEFRRDLYDRLMWVTITLPPLREQLDQLPTIIKRMMSTLCKRYQLSEVDLPPTEIEWCGTYTWPGNHRQLLQVLWKWHFFDRSLSIKSIVENGNVFSRVLRTDLRDIVLDALSTKFGEILAGAKRGYEKYGDLGDEMRMLAYEAIWQFNKRRKLTDAELKDLFPTQSAANVRKQISSNRPKGR